MNYKKNFTDVFPTIFSEVNGSELMVYLYICHHYCLSTEKLIKITYDEMCKGTLLDNGTTLSKDTLRRSIVSLKSKKLLRVKKKEFVLNGSKLTPCYYRPLVPLQNRDRADFTFIDDEPQNRDHTDFQTESHNDLQARSSFSFLTEDKKKKKSNFNLPLLGGKAKELDRYELASDMLKEALVKQKLLRRRYSRTLWANNLRKEFTTKLTIEWNELFDILKWFCCNVGDKSLYIPDIRSTKAFCDKLEGVEAAILRQKDKIANSDFHSTENLPPPEDDTPPLDDQLRRDAMSHLL